LAVKKLRREPHKLTGGVPVISKEVFKALPIVNQAVLVLMARSGEVVLDDNAGVACPGERKHGGILPKEG